MDNKFVIRSQNNLYLAKNKEDWITGEERNQVLALKHHDEALNTLIEKNAKDIQLRGTIVEVPVDEKGKPIVEVLVAAEELEQQDLLAEAAADQGAETGDDSNSNPQSEQPAESAESSDASAELVEIVEQPEEAAAPEDEAETVN